MSKQPLTYEEYKAQVLKNMIDAFNQGYALGERQAQKTFSEGGEK